MGFRNKTNKSCCNALFVIASLLTSVWGKERTIHLNWSNQKAYLYLYPVPDLDRHHCPVRGLSQSKYGGSRSDCLSPSAMSPLQANVLFTEQSLSKSAEPPRTLGSCSCRSDLRKQTAACLDVLIWTPIWSVKNISDLFFVFLNESCIYGRGE